MLASQAIYGLFVCITLATFTLAATAEDWQLRTIYQVITDRFATSDDKGPPCDTSAKIHCGGSWKGITNHLDYIQNMGFDAVWISPVVANIPTTPYGEAYHGYWSTDLNSLNSHFGTADDLKALGRGLHQRGMYLMLDVVVNHFALLPVKDDANPDTETYDFSTLSPFNSATDFHPECVVINDKGNQTNVEQCWLGDNDLPLADVNTEDPTVVQTLYDWIGALVKEYDADGVRIDTVKHVRHDFWPGFAKASGVFTMGEVISNDVDYTKDYTNVLDSVLDYPTWYALIPAFSSPTGNLSTLVETTVKAQNEYKNGAFMTGTFLENHDQARFASITNDDSLVRNAMAWPFCHDGIPIVYYGQEHGYQGSSDPSNREALWFTAYDYEKPLVTYIKTLNSARKVAISSSNMNFLTTKMDFVPQTDSSVIAISKPPLLALLTNGGNTSTSSWTIPASSGILKKRDTMVDTLSCETMKVDEYGGLVVHSNGGRPQLLMSASTLSKDGQLCASVATGSGNSEIRGMVAHWAVVGSAIVMSLARYMF